MLTNSFEPHLFMELFTIICKMFIFPIRNGNTSMIEVYILL